MRNSSAQSGNGPQIAEPPVKRTQTSSMSRSERRLLAGVSWLFAALFAFLPLSNLPATPPDLAQFYFAGRLVAAGQSADIYNPQAYTSLEQELAATGTPVSRYHFFNRPAFGALPWAILAQLPYGVVEKLVVVGNILGVLALAWKLPVWFPSLRRFRPWLLCYPPFMWSIQFGQETVAITWALAYGVVLVTRGREKSAGLLLSLCLIKPHLVWLIPVAFFFCGKRATAYWFLGGGLVLAGISFFMIGSSGVAQWRELLAAGTTDYTPETMATLRAIGLQTNVVVAVLLAIAVGVALVRACRAGALERALPISIVASVLLSPHAYPQDASSFAVAASFSGSGLLIGATILPWPLLAMVIEYAAYPFAYVAIGLVIIAVFARGQHAQVTDAAALDSLPRSS